MKSFPRNSLWVKVEDYFPVCDFDDIIAPNSSGDLVSRGKVNISRVLELLADCNLQTTNRSSRRGRPKATRAFLLAVNGLNLLRACS